MKLHAHSPAVAAGALAQWRADMLGMFRRHGMSLSRARRQIASLETNLHWVSKRLHAAYGTPHLGNLADPTDEFVFIVLSRKTPERAYTSAFESLKRIGGWERVLELGERGIQEAIHGGGLERKKARAIVSGLRAIVARFGSADLSRAGNLADEDLFAFLSTLPEVGPKSARCVMLYSFGRAVFPVDAHVGRVLARLGCMREVGIELLPMGHKQRQRVLEKTIPPNLRYRLHVNLVAHGRSICKAVAPACNECVLASRCAYARDHDARGKSTGRR